LILAGTRPGSPRGSRGTKASIADAFAVGIRKMKEGCMDATWLLVVLLLFVWLAGGLAVAFIMRRSGHDLHMWLPLGVLLGPLAALFAQERHRLDTQHRPLSTGESRAGPFDALAGIDGSEESIAAVRTALRLFGDSLSSLTLVTVLDYESSGSFTGIVPQSSASSRLADIASNLEFDPTEIVLLFGAPEKQIAALAAERGFELIIAGARGKGMSEALFGSVTEKLVGTAPVPVFVGSGISSTPDPPTIAQAD
jgi:nucleotide-binding universal stress UspA family protein